MKQLFSTDWNKLKLKTEQHRVVCQHSHIHLHLNAPQWRRLVRVHPAGSLGERARRLRSHTSGYASGTFRGWVVCPGSSTTETAGRDRTIKTAIPYQRSPGLAPDLHTPDHSGWHSQSKLVETGCGGEKLGKTWNVAKRLLTYRWIYLKVYCQYNWQ